MLIVLMNCFTKTNKRMNKKGTIKVFNKKKGMYFIIPDDGSKEIFGHFSQFEDNYQNPLDGDEVFFSIGTSIQSQLQQAENVSYIKPKNKNTYFLLVSKFCDNLIRMVVLEPSLLHNIDWVKIEDMIRHIFEKLGFKSILTPRSKDGGKDIIIEFQENGNNYKYYIEIKHWNEKSKVGENLLDNFFQVLIRDETDGGLFLSSSGYTKNTLSKTIHFEKQNLRLGNKNKIISLCRRYVKLNNSIGYEEPFSQLEIIKEDTIK